MLRLCCETQRPNHISFLMIWNSAGVEVVHTSEAARLALCSLSAMQVKPTSFAAMDPMLALNRHWSPPTIHSLRLQSRSSTNRRLYKAKVNTLAPTIWRSDIDIQLRKQAVSTCPELRAWLGDGVTESFAADWMTRTVYKTVGLEEF
jgi:hypothetical protein